MNALERLNAIAQTRALTEEESARMSYLVKYYNRTEEQKERRRTQRRESYARQKDAINQAKRERYSKDWLHAEKRRFQNRVSYRRRVR